MLKDGLAVDLRRTVLKVAALGTLPTVVHVNGVAVEHRRHTVTQGAGLGGLVVMGKVEGAEQLIVLEGLLIGEDGLEYLDAPLRLSLLLGEVVAFERVDRCRYV